MTIPLLIFFGIFTSLTIFPAIALLWQKNLIASAFLLLSSFMGIAALFLFCGAEFLAVTQILIYVGGILTLILFGILITKRRDARSLSSGVQNKKSGALITLSVFSLLIYLVHTEFKPIRKGSSVAASSHIIGYGIMGDYVLPFEIAGLLLLIVLVGVLALASSIKAR